jgi:hypothetical protein
LAQFVMPVHISLIFHPLPTNLDEEYLSRV